MIRQKRANTCSPFSTQKFILTKRITPVSDKFDDVYFSNQDGLAETHYVFLEGNQLWERWVNYQEAHFVIAETGVWHRIKFLCGDYAIP